MKTKTGFRRAALPIISVLAAAIISLTSVTYAWFTYGNEAKVEQITVDVEAAGGLQMSIANKVDGSSDLAFNWSSSINVNELIKVNNTTPKLTPVSTNGTVENGMLKFYNAQYDDVKDKIFDIKEVEAKYDAQDFLSSYITFDLYFRNVGSAKNISLQVDRDNETKVNAVTGSSYLATRIAFIQDSETLNTASTGTKPWTGNKGTTSVIFEPNATQHTEDGRNDYNTYKGTNTGEFIYKPLVAESGDNTTLYDRYTGEQYIKQTRSDSENLKEGEYFVADATAPKGFKEWNENLDYVEMTGNDAATELENNDSAIFFTRSGKGTEENPYEYELHESSDFEANDKYYLLKKVEVYKKATPDTAVIGDVTVKTDLTDTYFTLAENKITKVTVVIWIEGQDADCTNFIAGSPFSVDLVFNATEN